MCPANQYVLTSEGKHMSMCHMVLKAEECVDGVYSNTEGAGATVKAG